MSEAIPLASNARHWSEDATVFVAERPAWWARAACLGVGPDFFFPDAGNGHTATAKAMCADCPVRAECREYAIDNGESYGIWGGMGEPERRKNRRKRRGGTGDDPAVLRRRAAAVDMMRAGVRAGDIARELGVAPRTVHRHLEGER